MPLTRRRADGRVASLNFGTRPSEARPKRWPMSPRAANMLSNSVVLNDLAPRAAGRPGRGRAAEAAPRARAEASLEMQWRCQKHWAKHPKNVSSKCPLYYGSSSKPHPCTNISIRMREFEAPSGKQIVVMDIRQDHGVLNGIV